MRRYQKTKAHQRYKLLDGTIVPGGSTIAKIGDDPSALIAWAHKLGLEGLDYRKVRDQAADIGSLTHFMVECHLAGEEYDLSEFSPSDVDRAETCFLKFLEFWEAEQLEVVEVEKQIVSSTYGFGGTLDLVARDKHGYLVLLDWKTSKGIWRAYLSQISGYRVLWDDGDIEMIDKMPVQRKQGNGRIGRCCIVRIGKSDFLDFETRWIDKSDFELYFELFKCQLKMYNISKKLPKS